jgi:hypothetical protein
MTEFSPALCIGTISPQWIRKQFDQFSRTESGAGQQGVPERQLPVINGRIRRLSHHPYFERRDDNTCYIHLCSESGRRRPSHTIPKLAEFTNLSNSECTMLGNQGFGGNIL